VNIGNAKGFYLEERFLINPKLLFVGPKIGEGAHGKVYEGKYLDQKVAVKILQPTENSDDHAKLEAGFIREVSMLARVQHRNLVKFVGACMEPVMVIVTELMEGRSLKKYMLTHRPNLLDLRLSVKFALDIAQAMDCLHKNGIIHRDLKPDNLLLTADQKTLKLVDFGLAREEALAEMMTAETGTYRWMAPELYSTVTLRHGEKKHYNHKVDVYSFAIVLWELLSNRMPFEGMSNLQAAYAAAFKNTRPAISKSLPEDLVFILQSCWAEDPDIRPNFGQVVRMLTAFLSTLQDPEPVSKPPKKAAVLKASKSKDSPKDSPKAPKKTGKVSPKESSPKAGSSPEKTPPEPVVASKDADVKKVDDSEVVVVEEKKPKSFFCCCSFW
jgi:serine/threonine protein kinase